MAQYEKNNAKSDDISQESQRRFIPIPSNTLIDTKEIDGFTVDDRHNQDKNKQVENRPTLITGFTNGYNFSNNYLNSPIEFSNFQGVFKSQEKSGISQEYKAEEAADNQNFSDEVGLNKSGSPLAQNTLIADGDKYRTQPNSFDESFDSDIVNFHAKSLPKEDSFAGLTRTSTLLERDFPGEILPFELLEKKDGDYFVNNDKGSSLPNDNYKSLVDKENEMFLDLEVLNPLQETKILRVKTEAHINKLRRKKDKSSNTPRGLDVPFPVDPPKVEEPLLVLHFKKRARTYSESETANFSMITGERLYDDDKHRPIYSLDGNHEKLQDDSIHAAANNSQVPLENVVLEEAEVSDAESLETPVVFKNDYSMAETFEKEIQVPVNITIHGGTIVPDENFRPKFRPMKSYNKEFGLAKTHQISTSTLELLKPESKSITGKVLHPNVEIYYNFESLLGCEDEYIPGLDFKTSISQWFDNTNDYDRFHKLQIIGSHESIARLNSFENKDDVPTNITNPKLTGPAIDYSFKEIEDEKKVAEVKPKEYGNFKSKNHNLQNYKKNILNFNDYDYNVNTGGHDKFNHIPNFILSEKKKQMEDGVIHEEAHDKTDADRLFDIHNKKEAQSPRNNLSNNALSRLNRYSPVVTSPKANTGLGFLINNQRNNISVEYGTVIDTSTISNSSSVSSSPLHFNDIRKELKMDESIAKSEPKKVDYEELIDKLPNDFLEQPFSKRRKILLEILPPNDKHNKIDSKKLLTLIKKRFTKPEEAENSTAVKYLSRLNKPASSKKQNIDDRGSIVLNHELGKIIGYGSWGIVRECYSLDANDNTIAANSADGTHRLVRAIKIVKTKNEIVKKCFQKEIKIWKLLNHKRLLPLLFVKETSYATFCITPRIYGGTLFDIVSNWGFYNDPNSPIIISKRLRIIRKFLWEILDGLSYMHYNGIVHGDLKLENCLIDEIVNPLSGKIENHILICDFGMSCFYIDPELSRKNSSTSRSSFTSLNGLQNASILLTNSRPQIPRSLSSENLLVLYSKMHEIAFDRKLTHDDTPAGISSFQKTFGPAPTSTTLNLSPIVFNYIQNEQPINDKTPLPHTHIGSLPYASPEILLPNPPPLGPMADIWAFGVLAYTMAVGKLPFQHNFEPRLRAMISRGKYDWQCLTIACGNDSGLIDVIKGCLTKEITDRSDIEMIVQALQR